MMPELVVECAELADALRSLDRMLKRASTTKAVLSFENGTLVFALPGMNVGVEASGTWPGQARIPALFLRSLARVPPDGATVSVSVRNRRLYVGTSSVECVWQDASLVRIELPLNPDLRAVLSIAYRHTPADIERAGLRREVAEAERKRDLKVRSAHAELNDLGVTAEELRALVDAKLRGMPQS